MSNPYDTSSGPVGFGDKRVQLSTFDRYKGRAGYTDRVAFIIPGIERAYSYFHNNKLFRFPEKAEMQKLCRDTLGEPQQRFGLIMFHYATDQEGNLPQDEDGNVIQKLSGQVKLWAVSETRYAELSGIARSWPLLDGGFSEKQVDIMITCTEEKFQKMQIQPTPEAFFKTKQAWYDALLGKLPKAQERLQFVLGKTLSDLELMEALGVSNASAPSTGSTANAGEIDLSDIADDDD